MAIPFKKHVSGGTDMEPDFAFQLFRQYEELQATYGPFTFLDDDEIDKTPANLIWSSLEVDDGGHIASGQLKGNAVDWYLRASVPNDLKPMEVDVLEVLVFYCPDCDYNGCDFCDEDFMVEIDFERYAASVLSPDRTIESLWAFRKPLGFEYTY
jgi:hypothetical protein